MPFIGNAGQFSNIYEKNYETTTLRVVEGDAAYQAYNPADSHYKLITTLQEITDIGNVTSNTVQFSNTITGFTTTSNVGIANSTPTHTLDVGSKVYIDENASNTFWTSGTLYADKVLSETTEITNSVTTRDVLADKFFPKTNGFIEITSNVGVLNTAPVHTLDIGANVQIDEYGSNTFWTSGNVHASNYSGNEITLTGVIVASDFIHFSDKRVKTDISKIKDPLNKVCSINGYTYKRTDTDDDKTHTGVLAQEVMEVLPEVVHGSEDTTYSVAYGNMVGLLIEAIKELKLEIDELKKSR